MQYLYDACDELMTYFRVTSHIQQSSLPYRIVCKSSKDLSYDYSGLNYVLVFTELLTVVFTSK